MGSRFMNFQRGDISYRSAPDHEYPPFETRSPKKAVFGSGSRFHKWDKELEERSRQPGPGSYAAQSQTLSGPCAGVYHMPTGYKPPPPKSGDNSPWKRTRRTQKNIIKNSSLLRPTASSLFRFPASPRAQRQQHDQQHRGAAHAVTLAGPMAFGSSTPRPRDLWETEGQVHGERRVTTPGPGYYGSDRIDARMRPTQIGRSASTGYAHHQPRPLSQQQVRRHASAAKRARPSTANAPQRARRTASVAGFGSTTSRFATFLDPSNPGQYDA